MAVNSLSPRCSDSCVEQHSICHAEGEIDLVSAGALRRGALHAMDEHGPELTLDMSRVTFMDCSGLSVLARVRNEAISRGGHVTLVGLTDRSSRLLQVFGLHSLFGLPEPAHLTSVPTQVHGLPQDFIGKGTRASTLDG
jgi:anti-anti-sigma factor